MATSRIEAPRRAVWVPPESIPILAEGLLLKRLQPDGSWKDERNADGGVTSQFGFRIILDTDGMVRVLDARTGEPYPRPDEAWAEAKARRAAEERVRQLETELERLRRQQPPAGS